MMTHKTIILIAHGSRRTQANEEVHQLSNELAKANSRDKFLVAFLDEVAQPNIPETIDRAIAEGGHHITLLPYFLNTGNHVRQDIPAIVEEKRQQYPDVTIAVTEHFGAHPGVVGLLKEILSNQE